MTDDPNYATNIPARRDLIWAAFRVLTAKDAIKTLKRFEKRFGPAIHEAYSVAYEIGGYKHACIAVCHDRADQELCRRHPDWEKDQ